MESHQEDDTIRSMIKDENEFVHHRVTWLTTVQGLLFASVGVTWEKHNAQSFIILMCILGIVVSVFAFVGLVGSARAIYRLYDLWEEKKPDGYNGPGVIGLPPPESFLARYIGPWSIYPVVLFFVWTGVLYIKLIARTQNYFI